MAHEKHTGSSQCIAVGKRLSFDSYCPIFACIAGGVLRSLFLMGLALAMWSSSYQLLLPRSFSDNEDLHPCVGVTAQRLLGFHPQLTVLGVDSTAL